MCRCRVFSFFTRRALVIFMLCKIIRAVAIHPSTGLTGGSVSFWHPEWKEAVVGFEISFSLTFCKRTLLIAPKAATLKFLLLSAVIQRCEEQFGAWGFFEGFVVGFYEWGGIIWISGTSSSLSLRTVAFLCVGFIYTFLRLLFVSTV